LPRSICAKPFSTSSSRISSRASATRPRAHAAGSCFDGDVDCVVFLQTIEHVHDPDAVLERLARIVGPAAEIARAHPKRRGGELRYFRPRPRG